MDFATTAEAKMEIISVVATLVGALFVALSVYLVVTAAWGTFGDWWRYRRRQNGSKPPRLEKT